MTPPREKVRVRVKLLRHLDEQRALARDTLEAFPHLGEEMAEEIKQRAQEGGQPPDLTTMTLMLANVGWLDYLLTRLDDGA